MRSGARSQTGGGLAVLLSVRLCGRIRRGELVEQRDQLLFFFVRQGGEEEGKSFFAFIFQLVGARLAFFSQVNACRAAVIRIGTAFDVTGLLQLVDELGCRGGTDVHGFGDVLLAQAIFMREQDAQDAFSGEHSDLGARVMAEAAAVRTAVGTMPVRTVFTVRTVRTMTGTAAGAMSRAAVTVAAVAAMRAFAFGATEFGAHHHSHLAGRLHEALEKSFVDCFIRIHHIHSHSFFLSSFILQFSASFNLRFLMLWFILRFALRSSFFSSQCSFHLDL